MGNGAFYLSSYALGRDAVYIIYRPYLDELALLWGGLQAKVPGFNYCKTFRSPGLWSSLASFDRKRWRAYLKYLMLQTKGRHNVVRTAIQA